MSPTASARARTNQIFCVVFFGVDVHIRVCSCDDACARVYMRACVQTTLTFTLTFGDSKARIFSCVKAY